jgi:hypothetical protein
VPDLEHDQAYVFALSSPGQVPAPSLAAA